MALPVVREDCDFGRTRFQLLFGEGDFRNGREGRNATYDGRGVTQQVVLWEPIGDGVSIGSECSDANLGNQIGVIPFFLDKATSGNHLLPHGANDIVGIDERLGAQCRVREIGIGSGSGEEGGIEIDLSPVKRREVDFGDGGIDGIGHQELFGSGEGFGATATGESKEANEHTEPNAS